MAGLTFLYRNVSDVGSLVLDQADADFPSSNMVDPKPGKYAYKGQSVGHVVQINMSAPVAADYFCAAGDFTTGTRDTITLYGHTSNLGQTEQDWIDNAKFSITPYVYKRYIRARFASQETYRFWALFDNYQIGDPGKPRFGRVGLYLKDELEYIMDDGWEDRPRSTSTLVEKGIQRTVAGGIKRLTLRSWQVTMTNLRAADRETVEAVSEDRDIVDYLFIDPTPDDAHAKNLLYGRFLDLPVPKRLLVDRIDLTFPFLEVR